MNQNNSNNNNKPDGNRDHFGCGISIPATVFICVVMFILFVFEFNDYFSHYSIFELYFYCSGYDDDDPSNRTVFHYSTPFPLSLQLSHMDCLSNETSDGASTLVLGSFVVKKDIPATIKLTLITSFTFTFMIYSVCRLCSWSETRLRQRRHYLRVKPTASPLHTIQEEHGDLDLDEIEDNITREEKELQTVAVIQNEAKQAMEKQDPVKIQQLLRSATTTAASVVAGFEGRRQ
jgi:hypothetical protein